MSCHHLENRHVLNMDSRNNTAKTTPFWPPYLGPCRFINVNVVICPYGVTRSVKGSTKCHQNCIAEYISILKWKLVAIPFFWNKLSKKIRVDIPFYWHQTSYRYLLPYQTKGLGPETFSVHSHQLKLFLSGTFPTNLFVSPSWTPGKNHDLGKKKKHISGLTLVLKWPWGTRDQSWETKM